MGYQLDSYFINVIWIQPSENAIVTRPSDALVIVGSRAVFNCSTDLENPIDWSHAPIGAVESIDFYFLEYFTEKHTFYRSGFRVDRPNSRHYDLIIESVTASHAGRYECKDDAGYGGTASAELTVIESVPTCDYVVNADSTEAEVTCNLSLSGNVEPKLICQDGWVKSSDSIFSTRDRNGFPGKYLSTKARLSNTPSETHFSCYILRDYNSPPLVSVGVHVRVERKNLQNETSTSTPPSDTTTIQAPTHFVEPNNALLIPFIACTSVLLIIVGILGSILYKCHRYRNSTQRGKRIYLYHPSSRV